MLPGAVDGDGILEALPIQVDLTHSHAVAKSVHIITPGVGDFASQAIDIKLVSIEVIQVDEADINVERAVSSERVVII
jgi:hypothetical protein